MKIFRPLVFAAAVSLIPCAVIIAADLPWSQRAGNAAIARWPDGHLKPDAPPAWTHDHAALLAGIEALWLKTSDPRYLNYIKAAVDPLISADGSIPLFKPDDFRLTNYQLGRQLLLLYRVTHDRKYAKAADWLYNHLQKQPRTPSGGFWQGQANPNQMTPDGVDEALPTYAEYAHDFHHPEAFADITKQFVLLHEHAVDPKTGLMHQGWDESKQERWADKQTGMSATAWGRGMGWYMAAIVETLPFYPENDPGRKQLMEILNKDAAAVAHYQDVNSGLWYQIVDKAGSPGNFPEASASCLFVFALAGGANHGYLPKSYLANARRGYQGILNKFVAANANGDVTLNGTVEATDLGGNPYHDGSYEFYAGGKTVTNDPKGVGVFILASLENEGSK
jgi:unsaturated rhamnogalacturonyl hydrolase